MKAWLVDTGPLVALLVANDSMHTWSVDQVKVAPATVLTCDAVITETLFLLKRTGHDTDGLFGLIEAGFLRCEFDLHAEFQAVRDLMHHHRDMPMSFADACLVRMSEIHPDCVVWTLDRNFRVYRRNRRQTMPLVTPW